MNFIDKDFCGTDAFPFSISTEGCFVCIENGAQGMVKIRQEFLKVPTCADGNIIALCDGSDEIPYVELYDISTLNGDYAQKRICLLPSDFGYETKAELLEALAVAAGADIRLLCCAGENPFAVDGSDIFCGDKNTSYPACDYGLLDTPAVVQRNTLVTSVGRIPLPTDQALIVDFMNAWIAENGYQGTAIATTPGSLAPVEFRAINFEVYEIASTFSVAYVVGACATGKGTGAIRMDGRRGETPVVPDRLGLMKKSKKK